MPKLPMPTKTIAFLLTLLSFLASGVDAATPKAPVRKPVEPFIVVSLASYDRLYNDVALMGKLSGSPDLAQGLEAMLKMATGNRGLAGLDKKRPWAAVVMPAKPGPCLYQDLGLDAYVCLPVDDLPALLEAVRPFTEKISRLDDAAYYIDLRNEMGLTGFPIVQRGNWAVVPVMDMNAWQYLSAYDPMPRLGDLPKRYDLMAQVFPSRLPSKTRDRWNELDGTILGVGNNTTVITSTMNSRQRLARMIVGGFSEMDQITLGLALDQSHQSMSAELTLQPKKETPLAKRWNELHPSDSKLAGLRLPGATVEGHWFSSLSQSTVDMLAHKINTAKKKALRRLADSTQPAEQKELLEQLVANLGEVVDSLLAEPSLEATASVLLEPEAATLVSGIRLPAAGQSRQKIENLISLAQHYLKTPPEIELGSDRDGEVRLHWLSIPIPGKVKNREIWTRLFGEKLDLVVGLGKENFYLAAGRNALKTLRKSLVASRENPVESVSPIGCSVAMSPLAEAASHCAKKESDRLMAKSIATALKSSPGKDHLRLTAGPSDGGVRVRLELEEGLLRLVGPIVTMVGADQTPPSPTAPK